MNINDLLNILHTAEKLKNTTRHSYTSSGRHESVAEHTFRTTLMAQISSKMSSLMPQTISLEQGLKEEFEWYKDNIDSIYSRKPYLQYIDEKLK